MVSELHMMKIQLIKHMSVDQYVENTKNLRDKAKKRPTYL